MRSSEVEMQEVDEEGAIDTVLFGMDAELAALGHRRDKLLAMKEGMMQPILTGRAHVVEREGAA